MTLYWHAPDGTSGPVPPRLEDTLAVAFTGGDTSQLGGGLRLGEAAYWVCVGFRGGVHGGDEAWDLTDALAVAIDKHGYGSVALRGEEG